MLKLLSNENRVLPIDDFYIVEKATGLDELIFNISIYDENYQYLLEEAVVEYEQPYIIKAIDAGTSSAKIKCQIDLNELKEVMKIGYSNNSATLTQTVNGVLPHGWLFIDNSGNTNEETIEGDYTPYEIIAECANTYNVAFRFKPKEKQIYAYTLKNFQPLGAFASRELNLKEINYKGKSSDFFTRLYAFGKDGLSFANINDGKEYVDNFTYSDKIICAIMRDDNYTTMESLLEAAKKQVEVSGMPIRSYTCTVYDLAKTNPEKYKFQDFSLFSVVKLIDDIKRVSVNHQVVEYTKYPYYPEKNIVSLSTVATKIQNSIKNVRNQIENPQSSFNSTLKNTLNALAASISGNDGGNMAITYNAEGKPNGLMIMDTDLQATAKNVLWFNLNGITYSKNGVNGPYDEVWSFQKGGFFADFMIAGQMLADRIKGGVLSDATGKKFWNLDTGEFVFEGSGLTVKTKNFSLDADGNLNISGKYEVEYTRKIYATDYTQDDIERIKQINTKQIDPTEEDLLKYDFKGTGTDEQSLLIVTNLVNGCEEWYAFSYRMTIDPSEVTSLLTTRMTYWSSSNEQEIDNGSVKVGGCGISSQEVVVQQITSDKYKTFSQDNMEQCGVTGDFILVDGSHVYVTNGIITEIFKEETS